MKSRKRHASSSESADSAESDDSSSEESSGSEDSDSEGEQRRHKKHKKRTGDSSDDDHKKKKKRKHKKKKKKHSKKKYRDNDEMSLSSPSERENRERSKIRHKESFSSLSLEEVPVTHLKRSESRDASRSPQPTRYYESFKRDSRRRSASASPGRRRHSDEDFFRGPSREPSRRSTSRHDAYRKDGYKDEPYRKDVYKDEPYRKDDYKDESYRKDDYKNEPYRKDDYYKKDEYYKKDDYYKRDDYYKKDDYYRKESYKKDNYYKKDEYYKKDDYKQSHYESFDQHERYPQHRKYGQEDYRSRPYNSRGGYSNGRQGQGYGGGAGTSRGPPPHHRQQKDYYEDDRRAPRERDDARPGRGATGTGQQKEERARSQSVRTEERPFKRERDGAPIREKKSRFGAEDEGDFSWGKVDVKKEEGPAEKDKPNFGLSGKLAADANTVNGVVLKYSEPDDAKQPKRRWRFYPFKGDKALPILYIHRQSCFVLGREHRVVDIPLEHPSVSKQHAALQYRATPFTRADGTQGRRVRPYIIDLDSANGTFVNNKKIEARRFVELIERDVVKFGFSQREYVLLHENSKDDAADDDQEMGGDPEIGDAVTSIATIKREKQMKQERAHDDE